MTAPLATAFGETLVRLLDADPSLRLVVGEDPGAAAWPAQVRPDRVVPAPGVASRTAVGDGVRLAGCTPVTVLGSRPVDLAGLAPGAPVHILLAADPRHLGAAYRAGLTVVQPAWPTDLAPLLEQLMTFTGPVLLRLHDRVTGPPRGTQGAPPVLGEHRIVHRGGRGLVLAAGATAALLGDVARLLAGRDIHVTAVDAHTLRPGTGVDPALTDGHLLVGSLQADRAEALQAVAATPDNPRATADAVRAALPRLRPHSR